MSTTTKSRRRQQRFAIPAGPNATVEFVRNGRMYRLPVVNLSASGVSFSLPDDGADDLRSLEAGSDLPRVVVRLGSCEIRGDLMVMHLTGTAETRHVCGALLYPASDTDLVKLKSVIAGLEVGGTD